MSDYWNDISSAKPRKKMYEGEGERVKRKSSVISNRSNEDIGNVYQYL
jgi:hypothetical protein